MHTYIYLCARVCVYLRPSINALNKVLSIIIILFSESEDPWYTRLWHVKVNKRFKNYNNSNLYNDLYITAARYFGVYRKFYFDRLHNLKIFENHEVQNTRYFFITYCEILNTRVFTREIQSYLLAE